MNEKSEVISVRKCEINTKNYSHQMETIATTWKRFLILFIITLPKSVVKSYSAKLLV